MAEYTHVIEALSPEDYFVDYGLEGSVVAETPPKLGLTVLKLRDRPETFSDEQWETNVTNGIGFVTDGLVLRPITQQQPVATKDDREEAWGEYCSQMPCTASGRPFDEFAGDLHDAFDYGWQAALEHLKTTKPNTASDCDLRKFQPGDIVRAIRNISGVQTKGKIGIVRDDNKPGFMRLVGVEFLQDIGGRGHVLNGGATPGLGLWCDVDDIEHTNEEIPF